MSNPRAPSSLAPSLPGRIAVWVVPVGLGLAIVATWLVFLAGAGMRSVIAWVLLQSLLPLAGLVGLLSVGAVLARRWWRRRQKPGPGMTRPLATMLGVSLAALATVPWMVGVATMEFPYRLATTAPSATVRLPATVPLRVLWGGDRLATNHHASFPDQRWAYDLVVEPALRDSKQLTDYGCWGVEVVAPTAARVHLAHDGEMDLTPGPPGLPLQPLGNHVVLALPEGYLVLAHLQKDSVRVREGEQVAEGQPLGRCGNSGNTSEPHIHMHLQRQDPRGRPVNFSEGLPLFFRDHDGAAMPEGGFVERDGRAVATGAIVHHRGPVGLR